MYFLPHMKNLNQFEVPKNNIYTKTILIKISKLTPEDAKV